MVDAMSNSRRFLLLLLLGTLTCVVIVQVSMDGWRHGSSFANGGNNLSREPAVIPSVGTVVQPTSVTENRFQTTRKDPSNISLQYSAVTKDLPLPLSLQSSKKPTERVVSIKKKVVQQTPPVGKRIHSRRVPLEEVVSRQNSKQLVSRQERLQEILKQSSAVRGRATIDPMRSLKSIPIVKPENVKRIFLLTYFRAGSTFFGDLLQQNWKTFYHFEPLHSMTIDSRIGDEKVPQVFNLFDGIFKCNFTELKDYLDWVKQPHNQFLFAHNQFLWATCRNPKICFNPTFVNAVCQRAPVHVIKVTRLHMRHLRDYLQTDSDGQTKVVYLTRDPRGIVSSRWTLDWCNGTDCSDPSVLCKEMEEDIAIFDKLQESEPLKFIKLRYEDLSLNPEKEAKKLFEFLKLPFTASVQRFLKTHTVGRKADDTNPYSTRRNTTSMAFSWRERFTFQQVQNVQSSCETVLSRLNHSLITSPSQLPYPNGRKKILSSSVSKQKTKVYNKNPLYQKLHSQDRFSSTPHTVEKHFSSAKHSIEGKNSNNTNIEIHKMYKIVESTPDKLE